jgi:hypothetical protein
MPEAFAVLVVFVISVAAYVGALITARDPARQNLVEDLATLRQQHAWLQHRIALARRENWGEEMIGNLEAELMAAAEEIDRRERRERKD